jgi:hypothetical protein
MPAFHQLLRRFPGRVPSFAPCLPLLAKEPPQDPIGSTKSSTTAFALWAGVMAEAFASPVEMAVI